MSEKQNKIAAVIKPPREFQSNDGKTLHAHDIVFDDGEEGSTITGPGADDTKAMQDALLAVKGQEVEWELDSPREFQGVKKWKVLQFPGKPKGGGGGGGGRREWVDQTPSMEAQGAVKNAIAAMGSFNTTDFPDGMPEYIGLVRQMAKGLYKVVQDIKGNGAPAPATPSALAEDAVRIFGSEGAVQVAFKKMFGKGTSFSKITDEELEALIEQKNQEEMA